MGSFCACKKIGYWVKSHSNALEGQFYRESYLSEVVGGHCTPFSWSKSCYAFMKEVAAKKSYLSSYSGRYFFRVQTSEELHSLKGRIAFVGFCAGDLLVPVLMSVLGRSVNLQRKWGCLMQLAMYYLAREWGFSHIVFMLLHDILRKSKKYKL